MGHKKGHKKHISNNLFNTGSFSKDFKNGFIATGHAVEHTGKTISKVNPILKPIGLPLQGIGQIERYGTSGLDAIGAKNPNHRYNENMKTHF